MVLKLLLILLLLNISSITGQTCKDKGISNFEKTSSKSTRYTTLQNGNYIIQALVTFTAGGKCDTVTKDGLVKAYSIQYAIDKMNTGILAKYNVTLGLQLDDVCRSLPVTMARGIEVVSLHRPNSVCRSDFLKCSNGGISPVDVKEATAVIGTQMSFTTIPLASLMSLYYIPQVSYAASSRLLSKKDLYKSFFRTIPSDTNQISVMLDMFKKFDWNYIFAIGSDDDYGKLGVSDLKRDALKRNVCISNDEYIPYQSTKTKEKVKDVVTKIKKAAKAQVVVLFCYVKDLGDFILEEANKQGVKRIWLTSEAFNPDAASLPTNLRNQTVGLLSVSLKSYKMQYLLDYMEKEIKEGYKCNMWLKKYMENAFNCTPSDIASNKYTLIGKDNSGIGCQVNISDIMKKLEVLPGKSDNLIDAVTAIGHAISKVLEKKCSVDPCPKLQTRDITNEMFNISFINEQNMTVSFDSVGDPKNAFYTIENLRIDENGKHKFYKVGNWSQTDALNLNATDIQWPSWFKETKEKTYPSSRCSEKCKPGEQVVGQTGCCWGCSKCVGNTVTTDVMAEKCIDCGSYYYTEDNTKCLKRPILWLEIKDAAGMSITIISALGFIFIAISSFILFKFWHFVTPNDESPHLITMSCILLFLTYIYGPLHITEPTHLLCQTRNSIFFILLMLFSAMLLIRSKFMTKYLRNHAENYFHGNLLVAQVVFMVLMFLIEVGSVIAWLYIDKVQVEEFRQDGDNRIWRQCEVSFTAARLVSTFIPCIVLIIATFCAFRERNLEHSFYEPKFLSFTCIALCIIIVAFLPTFKYVVGIYKAIVMAFTMDVFGYTFLACLVLPKVYVAIIRNKRGMGEYPLKPGTATKKTEKDKVKDIRNASIPTSNDHIDATFTEASTISNFESNISLANNDAKVSKPSDIRLDDQDKEEAVEEEEINGYNNEIYDKSHDHVGNGNLKGTNDNQ